MENLSSNINYFKKRGDSYVFMTSLGLAISLGMVLWIVSVILIKGLGFFWPRDLTQVELQNGKAYLGELWAQDTRREDANIEGGVEISQIQLKIGNRDVLGFDFTWVDEREILIRKKPDDAVTFERWEFGNFYGFVEEVHNKQIFNSSDQYLYEKAKIAFDRSKSNKQQIKQVSAELGNLVAPLTRLHREISLLEISPEAKTEEGMKQLKALNKQAEDLETATAEEYELLSTELGRLNEIDRSIFLVVRTADGRQKKMLLSDIVRFFRPNEMSLIAKSVHYCGKLIEFVASDPRESNTEGGVFPAIFGTVMMVLLMSIAVVPFGVLAAVYLNEYAKQGAVVRFIRLSVNNLAGVPSIVFGVFGLGFFVYLIGGSIDQVFFSDHLPEPTFGTGGILWASITLALLTLPVVVVATEEGLKAVPQANKEGALALGSTKWQMVRKVVLPHAIPGILTGMILAISRGAGEVAPLMITGVVKLAPTMPMDTVFPFLHLDRKFMHLGFHIYDVGFQSPNVEAAKPMVYTTALLLIVIVVFLNLLAIYFRNRLRKKFKPSTF